MRRMIYNPFENVYSSGEYDPAQEKFVLDRNLETGHIYYAIIHSHSLACSFGPAFFDITISEANDFTMSMCPIFNDSQDPIMFGLRYNLRDKYIEPFNSAYSLAQGEDYTIYIYQLI